MRYLVLATVGIVGMFLVSGLRLFDDRADAQENRKSTPDTFAEYASHALREGNVVILSKDNYAGGYGVSLLTEEQAKLHHRPSRTATVVEVHSDYVVFRQEDENRVFLQATPYHVLTSITRYSVKAGVRENGARGSAGAATVVTGVVTLDGTPVADAKVVFVPIAGGQPVDGKTNEEGRYELAGGAPAGPYLVRIDHKLTPERYKRSSPLRTTLRGGENKFNFELMSD